MKILILEPFFTGSHQSWAEGLQKYSNHDIQILSLSGRHWKWRMHGGAISLANQFLQLEEKPDLIIASDMLDLTTFVSLTKTSLIGIPIIMYFHENQLSYPWSPNDQDVKKGRDFHYGFINWTSILSADKVYFNSFYNQNSFFAELEQLLKVMPDNRELQLIEIAKQNSNVLPLGIDLTSFYNDVESKDYSLPVILWNHRWEYDKNPNDFFKTLQFLKSNEIKFQLIVCGEGFQDQPEVFEKIKTDFEEELIHFGYAASREEYTRLLEKANVIPVTSQQEFFGQSVIEAIVAGCFPFLPNALAYPEHFPDSLKHVFLYNDIEQLQTNLKDLCANLLVVRDLVKPIQQLMLQYDWQNMINEYDKIFESLVSYE